MHTEDDLRAALSALEREAPNPAGLLASLERLRRRRAAHRRGVVMAAVVVVTMALAAGSFAAPHLFRTTSPAPPTAPTSTPVSTPPGPRDYRPWTYPFAVDVLPGTRVSYHLIDENSSTAMVLAPTEEDPAYSIEVFRPGKYDPTVARGGEPVDVAGKPGFYRKDMPCHCDGGIPGVAWEYAPDAWVFVRYSSPARQPRDIRTQVLKVAAAVHTDRTTPVRVPFRIGYLPAGLQPRDAGSWTFSEDVKSVELTLTGDAGGSGLSIGVPPILGYGADLPVGQPVSKSGGANPDPRVVGRGGYQVSINLGPFAVDLRSVGSAGPYPVEELERIARSITVVGQRGSPDTWIPAEEAMPAG